MGDLYSIEQQNIYIIFNATAEYLVSSTKFTNSMELTTFSSDISCHCK